MLVTRFDGQQPEGPFFPTLPATRVSVRPVQPFRPRKPHWWSRRRPLVPAYVALFVDEVPMYTGEIVSFRGLGDRSDYYGVTLR